jgi:hypothetical protein
VLAEVLLGDPRKTCGDPRAVQLGGATERAVVGHADRQTASADSQFHALEDVHAAFGNQVCAGHSHVDRPFGAKHGDVVGAQKRDLDGQVLTAGKQTAF